ncbi:hypothetical protein ACFONG_18390 [Uliginosibacterium paludis]|uniref:Phospholipase/carboxylesterase/thioesterase domain-containing protein n=1 Tax=Uliginosibacterium paludis TaxID=1615952 RepID=A0ABV2CTD1_9RHOO
MNRPSHPDALLHDTASGLDYRIRPICEGRTRGIVVLLHGVGGNEANLMGVAQALPEDLLVVLPRGPLTLGPGQHGWFQVAFSAEGPRINPQQAESARLQLLALLGSLQASTGTLPGHTLVAGFSQGGIMSASIALTSPWSVAGFGILSGRILPEIASQTAPLPALTHLQAFIGHGDRDATLPSFWADRAETLMKDLAIHTRARRYPAAHEITREMLEDFVQWADALLHPEAVRLSLGDETLELTADGRSFALAAGARLIAQRHFHHSPPTPVELENAIQDVEDALTPAWKHVRAYALETTDRWPGALAAFAGQSGPEIDRETVEACFNRLAALSEGRPLAQDPLPEDPLFAARLLVLRELMHHLDFTVLRTV